MVDAAVAAVEAQFGSADVLVNTDTALLAGVARGAANPEKLIEAFTRAILLGRPGRQEDLARAIVFLAGDDASFVTGQVLSVSGGLTMNG